MVARHNQIKNYCKFHPGESWHTVDYSRAGTCKGPKTLSYAQSQPVFAKSVHFDPNSPESNEWCSHQPAGMTYTASDLLKHDCPPKGTN
jgi:hypothetical protein